MAHYAARAVEDGNRLFVERTFGHVRNVGNNKIARAPQGDRGDDNDFYYWENIRKDYPTYKKVKDNVAEQVKTRIETRFPSLKGKIESIDVATPMTYNRYVNAHRGAYMPWAFTAKGNQLLHNSSVSGLKNLLFSGQWTIMPGGLPIALMSGKFAIQLILKKEHRKIALNK